jgi:hypothetical protein
MRQWMRPHALDTTISLPLTVMTGRDPVIHGNGAAHEDVDGRIKSGHD